CPFCGRNDCLEDYDDNEGDNKMPVYKKLVKTTDKRFAGRTTQIIAPVEQTSISVPDNIVLCNGCNQNQYPDDGYLVYLDKEALDKDLPYDFYCSPCVTEYFPRAILVE
ncbi:unnamed protein product, partial [marine sediment metagenome]